VNVPLVSIITALHNKGPYVSETICSVLAQTMPDWDLIVVENGSNDNGPAIIQGFSDARIRLVVSPKHGPGAARNVGLGLVTGDWVLFLDADDLLAPDYLEERLGLLEHHPQADLLAGCWEEFVDGAPEHKILRQSAAHGGTTQDIANAAIAYAPWALHAALTKRSRLINEKSWPEELDDLPSEDTAFWFPVIHGASVVWSERAGALYRIQTKTSRNEIKDAERWICAVQSVIQHNVSFLKAQNLSPNQAQCACIVRVLESTYRLGLSNQTRTTAKLVLEQATEWLHCCSLSSPSIVVRKLIGLRLFNLLRYGVI
jgi:glycosyltransferase involved in cell wall biosynthesis